MKVHICWITPDGDRILDRLARTLAQETGWSLSDRPDPGADLNYFMSYIDYAQRFSDWRKTRIAAYFSHFEPDTPYKRFWWETAAPLVDIKTVTADQYGAILPSKVVKVIPPVDPVFQIGKRKANPVPRIGVSGYVDRSGRKGEKLVARLAADLEGRAEIVASGQGWPARRVNDSLAGLPAFYNSLDLYLCASTIEGVPMPPLEALACGIPVVIPEGVGMLDELQIRGEGIVRYTPPGSYEYLKGAVDIALSQIAANRIHRQELREIVSGYTPAAWASSHVTGFEQALSWKSQPKITATSDIGQESDRHGGRGVYYVAYGKPARECAKGAISSFKIHMPDVPVALVSDAPLGPEDIFIQHPDEDIGGRAAKVQIYDLAPKEWSHILYLDVDTEVVAPGYFLFELVEDGWDMAICKNPSRFHVAREMRRSDNGDECEQTFRALGTDELIQLNGGVFCFQRNERTKAMFHAWEKEWRRWGKRDQAALLRALFAHPLKLYVLGNEWNTITRYDNPDKAAWLLHTPMVARRWRGVVHHRLDDPGAWEAVKEFERSGK